MSKRENARKNDLLIDFPSFLIKMKIYDVSSVTPYGTYMRNTDKTIAWLAKQPTDDQLKAKVKEVESHITRLGRNHPLREDCRSALFLLRQEEMKRRKTDKHLQLSIDFDNGCVRT